MSFASSKNIHIHLSHGVLECANPVVKADIIYCRFELVIVAVAMTEALQCTSFSVSNSSLP